MAVRQRLERMAIAMPVRQRLERTAIHMVAPPRPPRRHRQCLERMMVEIVVPAQQGSCPCLRGPLVLCGGTHGRRPSQGARA